MSNWACTPIANVGLTQTQSIVGHEFDVGATNANASENSNYQFRKSGLVGRPDEKVKFAMDTVDGSRIRNCRNAQRYGQ